MCTGLSGELPRHKAMETLRIATHAANDRGDSETTRLAALEDVLRRLIGRLCIAARGIDTHLDSDLARLASAMRRHAEHDVLEPLLGQITNTIARMDEARTAPAIAPAPAVDEAMLIGSLRVPVIQMLDRLVVAPALANRLTELKREVVLAANVDAFAATLNRIADLVNEQRRQLQRDRVEAESLLVQVTSRLDEIASFLEHDAGDQTDAARSSRELDHQVESEMRTLRSNVESADNLEALKSQVDQRLSAIAGHLREFRAREEARTEAIKQRADKMRARLEELEREADVLQRSLLREQRLASTDALTGIANRHAYDERIAHDFKRWKRFGRPLAIVTWDVDHFKSINDNYGHAAGDKVLHVVAQALSQSVREVDFVARYGGEEFAMILVGAEVTDAIPVIEGIRGKIAAIGFHFRGQPVQITISCGVALFRAGDDPERVLERADRALYRAKQNGRNRYELERPEDFSAAPAAPGP
jgi:diguanylate cyclase